MSKFEQGPLPITLYAPRQVIKTRWLRIDWSRGPHRPRNPTFSFGLSYGRTLGWRIEFRASRLRVVVDPISKKNWHPEPRWFWKPLPQEKFSMRAEDMPCVRRTR